MPGGLAKTNGYKVTWGGRTVARKTTRAKGQRQLNLLRAVKHGWKPTGKPARDIRRKSTRSTRRS